MRFPAVRNRGYRMEGEGQKQKNNPMHKAARCGARTRQGLRCQSPAIHGKCRCRMHGGLSTGAPKGNKNALKHGRYTAEAIVDRRKVTALLRQARQVLRGMQ